MNSRSCIKIAVMEQFEIRVERPKPEPLDRVIAFLKRLLNRLLECITCGCFSRRDWSRSSSFNGENEYTSVLLNTEHQAIQNLLLYLDNENTRHPVMDEDHVRALGILTYSDNKELQQSAALCYSEISEKMRVPITNALAAPLMSLLRSHDPEVQKVAALAITNFVINGPRMNRVVLVDAGGLKYLVPLLYRDDAEVQCNACGGITSLATTPTSKHQVVAENGIPALLAILHSKDLRVQRNAAGAILSLTQLEQTRHDLVIDGVIPSLIEVLHHTEDHDVQYYCCAALNNCAINEKHRAMMVAIGYHDVIEHMVRLLGSKSEMVKRQAVFVLRNLATDFDNQSLIVQYKALPALHRCIKESKRGTQIAAMACIRNLSLHRANGHSLLHSEILGDVYDVLCDHTVPEAQGHAAGIIRNISLGNNTTELSEQDCVEKLASVLLNIETNLIVIVEVTAALSVMAKNDQVKQQLISINSGKVYIKLITLATLSSNTEVQYNSAGILGQLSLINLPESLKSDNLQGIILYIDKFLKSDDSKFEHIALWTLVHLLNDDMFLQAFQDQGIEHIVSKLTGLNHPPTIQELAYNVLHRLNEDTESSASSSSET